MYKPGSIFILYSPGEIYGFRWNDRRLIAFLYVISGSLKEVGGW